MNRTARALLGVLGIVSLTLTGCGDGGAGGASSRTLTIDAASSLTEAFTVLGRQFERTHPGVAVRFNFDSSSTLAEQIDQGAPVDAFASASTTDMDAVVRQGNAVAPALFASNSAEIVVPEDNPAQVTSLTDLARRDVKVAVCQAEVPCGVVARAVFRKAGIRVTPATEEADVKSVLTKVQLGEVDAGVVYVTDVRAAGGTVHGLPIPARDNQTTSYPIAPLRNAPNAGLARQFVTLVRSSRGTAELRAAGFAAPQ